MSGGRSFDPAATAVFLLNRLIPKSDHATVYTIPDLDDNSEQLAWAADEQGIPVTVLVNHPPPLPARQRYPLDTRFLPRRSVRGFWAYLRSKYVIYSHSLYSSTRSPRNQLVVNVWHGMPIKKISGAANEHFVPKFDFTVATSAIFVPILARSF